MKPMPVPVRAAALVAICCSMLSAAPTITGVANAAANIPFNHPIAQGAIFVIYGSGLGPAGISVASSPFQLTTLSGTSVSVKVGGTTVNALMYYTSATQVAGLLPSNTPTGSGTWMVTYNSEASAAVTHGIGPNSFGIFTVSNNLSTIFSADGKQIFYASYKEDDRKTKYVIRRDLTTGEEKVMFTFPGGTGPGSLHGLSMAPDGRQVAFFDSINEGKKMLGWTLMIAPLSGGAPRDAGHPAGSWINPSWSEWTPDGRGVLVLAGENNDYNGPYQMWYIPASGDAPHRVGVSMPLLESIHFDPSGKRIGFTGGAAQPRSGRSGIYFPTYAHRGSHALEL